MSEAAPRGRRGRRGAVHSVFGRGNQEQSRALYHCNYCAKDISDSVRIKCADCADFDLCVECFSVGVEVAGHLNTHAYRVVDNLSFPIFHPAWGSDEELLLLEALEIYGPGNWAAVAEHVGTKSKEACQSHYFSTYIDAPTCPLPTPAPEMAGLDVAKLAEMARSNCGRKRMRLDPAAALAQHQQQQQQQQQPKQDPDAGGGAAGGAMAAEGGSVVKQEQQPPGNQQQPEPARQEHKQEPAAGHVLGKGAMRQRPEEGAGQQQQHQQQQQQHAEHPELGGLGKARQQEQQEQQQAAGKQPAGAAAAAAAAGPPGPLAPGGGAAAAAAGGVPGAAQEPPRVRGSGPQIDMMTGWHPKRFEFEPEWDNDAEASVADLEFREGDAPHEVAAKLRLLEVYNRRLDERARRQAFVLDNGLLNVRRMQGLDRRRMAGERERYAQMRVFARFQPPGSHDGLVDGLMLEGRLRMRIAELQAHRAAGRRTMHEIEEAEVEEAAAKKRAASKSSGNLVDEGSAAASAAAAAADPAARAPGDTKGLGGYRSTASALNAWRQRRGVPLDVTGLPGAERLSAREAELCAASRLLPVHYLSLKDVMMRDAEVHGHISRTEARGFFRLDPGRSARVWELLCSAGWLRHNRPDEADDRRRGGRPPAAGASAASAGVVVGAGGADDDAAAAEAGSGAAAPQSGDGAGDTPEPSAGGAVAAAHT